MKISERRNVPSPQLISTWKLKPRRQRKVVKRSRLIKGVDKIKIKSLTKLSKLYNL